jgi:hypothetical protein
VGSWGIQPSEFERMTLVEWGWLFEMKRPARTGNWAGNLTDKDVVALSAALDEAQEREAKQNGKN